MHYFLRKIKIYITLLFAALPTILVSCKNPTPSPTITPTQEVTQVREQTPISSITPTQEVAQIREQTPIPSLAVTASSPPIDVLATVDVAATETTEKSTTTINTATPCSPVVTALIDLNIRSGPDPQYNPIGVFRTGSMANIIGKGSNGNWWLIECPIDNLNNECWISNLEDYLSATCIEELGQIPVVTPIAGAPPQLLSPSYGTYQNPFVFSWRGSPDRSYQVTLKHLESERIYMSGFIRGLSWTFSIPGEEFGNWEWFVTSDGGAKSSTWNFVFDPFPRSTQRPPVPPSPIPPTATFCPGYGCLTTLSQKPGLQELAITGGWLVFGLLVGIGLLMEKSIWFPTRRDEQ